MSLRPSICYTDGMQNQPLPYTVVELFHPPNVLTLESGKTLGPIELAYETFGKLNRDRSNVILVCHALTGDTHAATHETNDEKEGWWHRMIGPEKPIDTNRYFVICINVLGSCYGSTGPASINPSTGKRYGLDFPVLTINDIVRTQKALLDHLNIPFLVAVIGGSMGGMQALEWAISYPDSVRLCIPIAAAVQLSPQSLAFNVVGREAILSDPNWNNGHYTPHTFPKHGLSIARMIGHVTYRSNESIGERFGRKLQKKEDYGYDFSTDFELESYLKYQGDKFVDRFDANCYLYLAKAMSYFDLPKRFGSLETAFAKCQSSFLALCISSDWLYPPSETTRYVHALLRLGKKVSFSTIDSPHGHDAFLMDTPPLFDLIRGFLGAYNE